MLSQEKKKYICIISILNITKAFVMLKKKINKKNSFGQNKANYRYHNLEIEECGDISPADRHSLLYPNCPSHWCMYV